MAAPLKLISHKLCPYVQRAVIALTEKGVTFERIDIDLAHKPDWFLGISPLGKTPVLLVGDVPIFESAVILEYLEETQPKPLHPADALVRAEHRGWIEFGSAVLSDIAGFYAAKDESFSKRAVIDQMLLDHAIEGGSLISFGDGYVELTETKAVGGTAVAVACDEENNGSGRIDMAKRELLANSGADLVIPDYRDGTVLMETICGARS